MAGLPSVTPGLPHSLRSVETSLGFHVLTSGMLYHTSNVPFHLSHLPMEYGLKSHSEYNPDSLCTPALFH